MYCNKKRNVDKLDLVASAKENECSLKTEQKSCLMSTSITIDNKQSSVRRNEHSELLLESLILAQDERWRRA